MLIDNNSVQEAGTLEENVLAFLNKHSIPMKKSDISICHRFKSKSLKFYYSHKMEQQESKAGRDKKCKELKGSYLVKGVQCYELFGGIALKIHTF